MSLPKLVLMNCRNCAAEQSVTLWESVNLNLNPELKPQVMDQSLLRPRCTGCGSVLMFGYSLLYHDMHRHLMISLEHVGHENRSSLGLPDYRLRVVRTASQLVEKITVFDADLDDRALEILKVGVLEDLIRRYQEPLRKMEAFPLDPAQLHFIGTSPGERGSRTLFLVPLLGLTPGALLLTAENAYSEAVRLLAERNPPAAEGEWLRVDCDWAKSCLGDRTRLFEVEIMVSPEALQEYPVGLSLLRCQLVLVSA